MSTVMNAASRTVVPSGLASDDPTHRAKAAPAKDLVLIGKVRGGMLLARPMSWSCLRDSPSEPKQKISHALE